MTPYLKETVDFLNAIGIECIARDGSDGFLKGCRIERGKIYYDPTNALPSNLLHEAGHLAIMPAFMRRKANHNLEHAFNLMEPRIDEILAQTGDPNHPEIRAMLQSGDTEATAWAFAAGRAAGLPDDIIILDEAYENTGSSVRMGCQLNAYPGINGLRFAGFLEHVRDYPALKYWLQP